MDRKSFSGHVFKFYGGSILKNCKQRTVGLATTEAEYVALSDATKEVIYLKNLLLENCIGFMTVFKD